MNNDKEIIMSLYNDASELQEKVSELQRKLVEFLSIKVRDDNAPEKPKQIEHKPAEVEKSREINTTLYKRVRRTAVQLTKCLEERNAAMRGADLIEMMTERHSHEWKDLVKSISGITVSLKQNPLFMKFESGTFEDSLFMLTEWKGKGIVDNEMAFSLSTKKKAT